MYFLPSWHLTIIISEYSYAENKMAPPKKYTNFYYSNYTMIPLLRASVAALASDIANFASSSESQGNKPTAIAKTRFLAISHFFREG